MRSNNFLKSFFLYPPTIGAAASVLAASAAFVFWFGPDLTRNALVLGVDIVFFCLWFPLALSSPEFKAYLAKNRGREDIRELQAILSECSPDFRKTASQCVEHINKIRYEFKSSIYDNEMDFMLQNIISLARGHRSLYKRYNDFGTASQKQNMAGRLSQQEQSLTGTLNTLKALSGNLTLLEAEAQEAGPASEELKHINQSLQDVIKEMENE